MRRIGHLMDDKMYSTGILHYKFLLITGLLVFISSCSPTPQGGRGHVGDSKPDTVGWLHGNCYAAKTDQDLNNHKLTVVRLGDKQAITEATLVGEAGNGEECYALLEDRAAVNREEGRRFYLVSSREPIDLAIGIVNPGTQTTRNDNMLDLDKDGKTDTFSYCSTSEGVRFSVWDGTAYKSKRLWSDYYYLGYDTESDCPAE